MLDFILNGVFWVLALYGLFEIIKNILYIFTYTKFKSDGIYVIVAAKNQENTIEGFLRTFLFRLMYGKEDETMKILSKLSKDYKSIKFINWKDCKEVIDSVKESN